MRYQNWWRLDEEKRFDKAFETKRIGKMAIMIAGEVVEFIVGSIEHLVFGDEGQPGLEVGFDEESRNIVAYMCLDFLHLYPFVQKGLQEKPIPGRFSVETVEDIDTKTNICDPRVKNATFAEIVEWLWEKYYAHIEHEEKVKASARAGHRSR